MKGTILALLVFKVQEAKYSLDMSPEKYSCVPDLITPGSNSYQGATVIIQFYKDAKTQANNGDRIETHVCLVPNPVPFTSCKAALNSDSVCSLLVWLYIQFVYILFENGLKRDIDGWFCSDFGER